MIGAPHPEGGAYMSRTLRIIGTILLFFAIGFYLIATITGDVLTVAKSNTAKPSVGHCSHHIEEHSGIS